VKSQQSFDVALDPRLTVTADDLAARLAVLQRIHTDLDTLNRTINDAIAARDQLASALSAHRVSASSAQSVLTVLNDEINSVVQLGMHSSEGSVLHEAKLRSWIAYIASDIDLAYAKPTAAQYSVVDYLEAQAKAAEQELQTVTAQARSLH
jgi:hypothetical protein